MNIKRYILATLLLAAVLMINAEINSNAGEYGMQFLQNPTNPVALALAGRGSYSDAMTDAYNINPAAATIEARRAIGISHTLWLFDTNLTSVGYTFSDRKSNIGLSWRALDYGKLERRLEDTGELIGEYQPLDMCVKINYGRRLTPNHFVGINSGVLYEKLNTASAIGMTFDLGYIWLPPVANARIGATVSNLGFTSAMDEERIDLPLTFALDMSKGLELGDNLLTLELTGLKAIDDNLKGSFNCQYDFSRLLSLRAGYKLNYDDQSISAGIGLKVQKIRFDYGWAGVSNDLNDVHSLTLGYEFD